MLDENALEEIVKQVTDATMLKVGQYDEIFARNFLIERWPTAGHRYGWNARTILTFVEYECDVRAEHEFDEYE
jgi:hypothetical protein